MSTRSLTQGLDVINMDQPASIPGVRTSVINSYLSHAGQQNLVSTDLPTNALVSTISQGVGGAQSYSGASAVNAAPRIDSAALNNLGSTNTPALSPGIYSVVRNSIVQALAAQASNSSIGSTSLVDPSSATVHSNPSSNVNALLSNNVAPGNLVDSAGAQINSFVNSLVFTIQGQTNLSPADTLGVNSLQLSSSLPVVGSQALGVQAPGIALSSETANSATNTAVVAQTGSSIPVSGSNTQSSGPQLGDQTSTSQTSASAEDNTQALSNTQGWVVGRVSASVQTMIEMLAVNQAQNDAQQAQGGVNPSIAALDSLIQSANFLFTSLGLSSTVTASTLQTALQEIQLNLMSAPAQGQWINVVA
jgi:hypothetical protein